MLDEARQILNDYFGYDSFRQGQEQIIKKVLCNQRVLGIMPTGGGKSLCYQIPSLMMQGLTIVISPLISLMKDQVDELNEAGIEAIYINSTLSAEEVHERLQLLQEGKYRLLYLAPERLENKSFLFQMNQVPISLIAVDEAHCVSQWGHDFRPSYLHIPKFLRFAGEGVSVLALTATATPQVAADISHALAIKEENQVKTGFKRENLAFSVIKGQQKDDFIVEFIKKHLDQSGIIYAATRKEVERLYEKFHNEKILVEKYHGGMEPKERATRQERFVYDEVKVMVATNAFGMGINKSNVRYVLHAQMPRNIESYYQEAGRAGRDGAPSDCILLYSPGDVHTHQFLIEQTQLEPERKEMEYHKLRQMVNYCHTEECLENYILHYFGEGTVESCGNCLHCTDEREHKDVTVDAQKVLSCVKRMRERYGKTLVVQVLTGSESRKIKQLQLNNLPTYALMRERSQKEVTELIDFLIAHNYLKLSEGAYPVLTLTSAAAEVLLGNRNVNKKETLKVQSTTKEHPLFEELRKLRSALANENNVPPYMIFSDQTLLEICTHLPGNYEEMLKVKGVGRHKLESYGDDFLEVVDQYQSDQNTIRQN